MTPGLYRALRNLGAVLALAAVVFAIVVMLWPLPTETFLGSTVSTCGPNTTSDDALQVLGNPKVVVQGEPPLPTDAAASSQVQQRQQDDNRLIQLCKGKATTRAQEAAVVGSLGLIIGLGVPWVARAAVPKPNRS